MDQTAKQKTNKKIAIAHLYEAIAKMRSEQRHNGTRGQLQHVIEILKSDYGISVPDTLHKTIGRRIKEFKAGQI